MPSATTRDSRRSSRSTDGDECGKSGRSAGDTIEGTGGARKVRFAGCGQGKRGGYRVISYFDGDDVLVFLLTCSRSGGATPGERADDLYVVCGQAQKSVKWTWNLNVLVKHLITRDTEHRRGRPSRFLRGTPTDLVTLRKGARRKFVEFRIGIVQPGLSQAGVPAQHLAVLGATNSFIQAVTDHPLMVCGSP
jgi:mRNA-degrading endonuclease RelE of RelBE toxin-antitoxin system